MAAYQYKARGNSSVFISGASGVHVEFCWGLLHETLVLSLQLSICVVSSHFVLLQEVAGIFD